MGPAGLTAVFGMGTGVTPPVWSPEMPPAGGQARRPRFRSDGRSRTHQLIMRTSLAGEWHVSPTRTLDGRGSVDQLGSVVSPPSIGACPLGGRRADRGGQALGC